MEILRRTPWSRIRERNSVYKEFLEIVGNGKPTGNVWKETIVVSATIWISVVKVHHQIRRRILSCGRVSENHRGPEVPEVKARVVECLDGFARITSKELTITHFVKSGTLQSACSTRPRVVVSLGKVLIRTSSGWWTPDWKVQKMMTNAENTLPTNFTTDRKNLIRGVIRSWDKSHINADHLVHGNWVAYFKTWRRRSLFSRSAQTCGNQSNVLNSQRPLPVTLKIRDQNPSLGYICPGEPHERSSNAPKFEDQSQEETEWQEQGAREAAWKLAKNLLQFKEHGRATFLSPSENRCLPASILKLEERKFVVDSGASMHMISEKDLSDAKWILWRNRVVLR